MSKPNFNFISPNNHKAQHTHQKLFVVYTKTCKMSSLRQTEQHWSTRRLSKTRSIDRVVALDLFVLIT